MTRQDLQRVTTRAVLLSGVAVPAAVVLVRLLFGPAEWASVYTGSALATAFFAVTAVIGIITWKRLDFRTPLIVGYGVKITALLLFMLLLPTPDFDSAAFATGVSLSAVSYLLMQVLGLSEIGEIKTSDKV